MTGFFKITPRQERFRFDVCATVHVPRGYFLPSSCRASRYVAIRHRQYRPLAAMPGAICLPVAAHLTRDTNLDKTCSLLKNLHKDLRVTPAGAQG